MACPASFSLDTQRLDHGCSMQVVSPSVASFSFEGPISGCHGTLMHEEVTSTHFSPLPQHQLSLSLTPGPR